MQVITKGKVLTSYGPHGPSKKHMYDLDMMGDVSPLYKVI